jgi:pyruvate formate-lyase activating enzyme-like uncharacterized protein
MKLNDISDESEYNIDNRTYYSQNYNITVMAYIMPKDGFIVEEKPNMKFIGFEGEARKGSYAEIEELPHWYSEDNEYEYIPMTLKIVFKHCSNNYKFTIDTNFKIKKVSVKNIRHFKFYINDNESYLKEDIDLKEGDIIKINGLTRFRLFEDSEITIEGVDYKNIQKVK